MLETTSLGGGPESFPETAWDSVLGREDTQSPERPTLLDRLCRDYWRPIFGFIRSSWTMPVEDAKDLTQQFFEHLLEGHLLSRYDPRQGRFRHFLKGALRLFLAEARRDRRRQKRGGGKVIVSIALEGIEESHGDSPEEAFDRQWTQDVLANSLMRLRRRLVEEGKELYFRAYELYELAPERSTYESVGAKLGLSAGDVRNYLSCVRARLRELVIETVAGYAGSPEEISEEIRELFSE